MLYLQAKFHNIKPIASLLIISQGKGDVMTDNPQHKLLTRLMFTPYTRENITPFLKHIQSHYNKSIKKANPQSNSSITASKLTVGMQNS